MIKGFRMELDSIDMILARRGLEEGGRVQQFIDNEVLKLCEPYIPRDAGTLIDSGILNTEIGSGQVVWCTSDQHGEGYAVRWYYQPANFQGAPRRGNHWFDRMMNEGGREAIVAGAAKEAGGKVG